MEASATLKVPFTVLGRYFERADLRESDAGGPYKRTAVGQFVPSPLRHIHAAMAYLLGTGGIDASGPLLDAGSGDGRVVALASLVHGIPTVGVEYDVELLERSKRYIRDLGHLRSPGAPVTLLPGDFLDDDTYLRAGMRFDDFATVFNYINNESALAEKVASQSPPGTKLLLLGAFPVPGLWGLTLEQNLELVGETDTADSILVVRRPLTEDSHTDPDATYLQVYRR